MADKIRLVQGDTRPALVCTLSDENTGNPITLNGANVFLKFRQVGETVLTGTLTGTVSDPAQGVVVFYWAQDPTILDGPAGDYEGEIEIVFSDSTRQTVYDPLKFKIREDF
jgi:hypothetical protein